MASTAYASPFHFARQVTSAAGESPVAMRRRVLLEQAAWRLQRGDSVTEVAFAAGYDSVDGFSRAYSRAFGFAPSATPPSGERSHWLPAPNGLHFHSPTVLYIDGGGAHEGSSGDVLTLMVRHDVDDTAAVLRAAVGVEEQAYRRERLPGHQVLAWAGPEATLADALRHLALDKLPWIASIEGEDEPHLDGPDDAASLLQQHERVAARWLSLIRDIERRGAWQDRVIDALCDPPESFVLAQIVAHVLTFSAHRRQLARWMLHDAGVSLSADVAPDLDPDPIVWHRRTAGGTR